MKKQRSWLAGAANARAALGAMDNDLPGGMGGYGGSGWQRLFGHSPEMMDVSDEVAEEQRGRVVIAGRSNLRCRQMLAALRAQELTPEFSFLTREGFFTLVDLSAGTGNPDGADAAFEVANDEQERRSSGIAAPGISSEPDDASGSAEALAVELADADLLLYLYDGGDGEKASPGWKGSDAHWYSRLRTLGAAMLPVSVVNGSPGSDDAERAVLRGRLGVTPASVPESALAACTSDNCPDPALNKLVERMMTLRPRLAMPLAQEIPFCRRMIAAKVVRTGALMAALVGAEPIPLLDLPLHVAVQWKVALQVAAIYGRPGLDVRSAEMAGVLSLSLMARTCAQQAIKLVPVIGWMLSSALSGVSALLLGHSLVRVYEQDHLLDLRRVASTARIAAHGAAHLRSALGGGLDLVQKTVSLSGLLRHSHTSGTGVGAPNENGFGAAKRADRDDQIQEVPLRRAKAPASSAAEGAASDNRTADAGLQSSANAQSSADAF